VSCLPAFRVDLMGLTFSSKRGADNSLAGLGGAVDAIDMPAAKADASYRYLVLGFGTAAGLVAVLSALFLIAADRW